MTEDVLPPDWRLMPALPLELAARLLGCTTRHMRNLFAAGKVRSFKPAGRVLVPTEDLLRILEPPPIVVKAPEPPPPLPPPAERPKRERRKHLRLV